MSRTTRYKILWLAFTLVGTALALLFVWVFRRQPLISIVGIIVLLLPGRIAAYCWRDFFRGRRLLAEGKAEAARTHLEAFLAQLAARPWLKKLIWCTWGMYTRDIEAMARGNLAIVHAMLGETEAAEREAERCRQLDPLNPKAWLIAAALHLAGGNAEAAEGDFQRARELGWTGGATDLAIGSLGSMYARIEGR